MRIYIHVNCINCFLGYFLIKMRNRALQSTLYICMHSNFVLTSGRNFVPIILPIPSVEPRFISPFYRFHTQNGGWKICAHLISTPRNCTKLCTDKIICSHASHSICTTHSWNHIAFSWNLHHLFERSHCILLEFAPPIRRNYVMHSYNLHHSIVYCCHYFRAIALPPNIILLPILSLFILCWIYFSAQISIF